MLGKKLHKKNKTSGHESKDIRNMPLTPRFKLSQTDTHLTITIHLPHIRVSASTLDILVDGTDFHFHSAPYLLYLSFPGSLLDDAETCREAKATYDPSNQNGILTVVIWKEEEGIWKDLDLLGNLVNRSEPPGTPKEKIQVISSSENQTKSDNDNSDTAAFTEDINSCLRPRYGFLNMHHSVFTAYAREGLSHDMLEIPDPDGTSREKRRDLRLDAEITKFDSDRYLGDLFASADPNDEENVDMIYSEAMQMTPHWEKDVAIDELVVGMEKLGSKDNSPLSSEKQDFFSNDESLALTNNVTKIPPISSISKEQKESLFLSLLDILYAYAYDHRTTFGDATCESSWTIVMLSPTLSWFESYTPPYEDVSQILRWSIRRALIYPYLRNFEFVSRQLAEDLLKIFLGGRRVVIRCLLQIKKILDGSEFHYLFNKLYINPYITWMQMISEEDYAQFASKLKSCVSDENTFAKSCFGLDLDLLERAAFQVETECENLESSDSSDDSSTSSQSTCDSGEESSDDDGDTNISSNLLDSQIGNGSIFNIGSATNCEEEIPTKTSASVEATGANKEKKKILISEI